MQTLSTKLAMPPVRSRLVARPRLLQKLSQGLDCGFILVSAPAGYGKSTLLSSWLARLELPSAWISLDDGDNDPARFITYLLAACGAIDPAIKVTAEGMLITTAAQDIEPLLAQVINQLDRGKRPGCLVLDDYHLIQNQVVHQAVGFLLEHRPATLKLILSTRADPPMPLARLRARSCVLELRMADLRFTPEEAVDFLGHTMGIRVSEEEARRLTQRTEGWIAGLQMAALSLQNASDVPAFIRSFTGSHHYIFDYLLEEILDRQTPQVQRFLLYTSILDHLCGPLCDALLDGEGASPGSPPAAVMLEQLDHANLFIIPLDHEQRWYRYHPLFAELLAGYLKKNEPSRLPVLHSRASAWLEGQGLIPEAIRHALAAEDWELAIRLISANIFALLEQKELNSVTSQIEHLTGQFGPARRWLLVGQAWLSAYTGKLEAVEPLLKLAEQEIDNLHSEVELQTLGGHAAAIRAYANWMVEDWEMAALAARTALEWLPENEFMIRCQVSAILGLALRDLDAGAQAFEQAAGYAKKTSLSHVTIFAYASWAWLLAMQGKLHTSLGMCQETIAQAQASPSLQSLPTLSHAYTTLSFLLYEWNDLEGALRYANEAVELARRWEQVDALHFALSYQAYALSASGAAKEASNALREAWHIASQTSQWFKEISISQEIDMLLEQDDLEAARQVASQAGIDSLEPAEIRLGAFKSAYMAIVIVRYYVAQGRYNQAVEVARNVVDDLQQRKLWNYTIRTLTWQALAHHGLHQDELALDCMRRALALAAPEGYVRTFVSQGARLVALLRQARKAGIHPEYVDRLLKCAEQESQRKEHPSTASSNLAEALTDREMEVLNLLARGCTDKKIAENLVIARETVHKHLKNIYGKLDVHSRTEAIVRAHELDLL